MTNFKHGEGSGGLLIASQHPAAPFNAEEYQKQAAANRAAQPAPAVEILKPLEQRFQFLDIRIAGNAKRAEELRAAVSKYSERVSYLQSLQKPLLEKKAFVLGEPALPQAQRRATLAQVAESLTEIDAHLKEAIRWRDLKQDALVEIEEILASVTADERAELSELRTRLQNIEALTSKTGRVAPMVVNSPSELGDFRADGNRSSR